MVKTTSFWVGWVLSFWNQLGVKLAFFLRMEKSERKLKFDTPD
jgi:hypothetical protein